MEEKRRKVNVLIPCYNNKRFLEPLINNLTLQTYDDIEVIFVDDGSTDGSGEEMKRLSGRVKERGFGIQRYWQPNSGLANSYETALKHADADYIFQIDCDDLIENNAIEKMAQYLDDNKDVAVVRSNGYMHYLDDPSRDVKFTDLSHIDINVQHEKHICEKILRGEAYLAPPCSYMYRLDAILICYPGREIDKSRIGQNYQILLPLVYRFKAGYIDECLFYYTQRGDSLEHSYRTPDAELWNIDESARLIYSILKEQGAGDFYAKKWAVYRRDHLRLAYAYKYSNKEMARKSIKCLMKYKLIDADSIKDYIFTEFDALGKIRRARIKYKNAKRDK